MKCDHVKSQLSPYLDGELTGRDRLALAKHLEGCDGCTDAYASLRNTQRLLAGMGRKPAPVDLELNLRLAISREAARSQNLWLQGLRIQARHAFEAFMVPASAGLVATALIFGVLMGFLTPPLQADNRDVPLLIQTAPQMQQTAFGMALNNIQEDSLVIEAYIGSDGRVEDYRILSGPGQNEDLPVQVKNMLIFTTFRPATLMGQPTSGRAVLSFSKISVKG